ncbi:hypothetical protein [Kordia jejudonensis]|uniref:hypothetical protein n=1 Tax=Kordia jejudonensis TaxID=1348245 RepID=UPI0006291F4D|nr:hypothetical protein [Kordia jejudonensis]
MLKSILGIKGVSELNKKEQLKITGGNGGVTEHECNLCDGFYVGNGYCVVDEVRQACLDGFPGGDD